MVVTSVYASNIGALVCNLAKRGYMIRIATEESVIGGTTMYLQVSDMKNNSTIKEALSEREVDAIQDINIVADALSEKLRKSKGGR